MGNKCEWKDGRFEPCEKFNPKVTANGQMCYCVSCDINIMKPEPQAIIRKSGGTWVAKDYMNDWFCDNPEHMKKLLFDYPDFFETTAQERDYFLCASFWKPISEIEITDEIALLRPMVIDEVDSDGLETLFAARGASVWTDVNSAGMLSNYRLATVEDLG